MLPTAVTQVRVHMPSNYHRYLLVNQWAVYRSASEFFVPAGQHARLRGREVHLPVALRHWDAVGICHRVSWKQLARDPAFVMQWSTLASYGRWPWKVSSHDTRRACVLVSSLAAAGCLYISCYYHKRVVKWQIATLFASTSF